MAMPFKVFEVWKSRIGYVWCVRCEDWIPLAEAYGGEMSYDPHIQDHLEAYRMLERLHRGEKPHAVS